MPTLPNKIGIGHYRFDEAGIRDRFIPIRFGYWKFAVSIDLEENSRSRDKGPRLVFVFDGRKRPLKVDLSNGKQLIQALTFTLERCPGIALKNDSLKLIVDSIKELSNIIKSEPQNIDRHRIRESELLRQCNAPYEAIKNLSPVLGHPSPLQLEARRLRLLCLIDAEEHKVAKQEFETIETHFPNDWITNAYWNLHLLNRNKNLDTLRLQAESLIALNPKDDLSVNLLQAIAASYSREGNYQQAIEHLKQIQPDSTNEYLQEYLTDSQSTLKRLQTDKHYRFKDTKLKPWALWSTFAVFVFFGLFLIGSPGYRSIKRIQSEFHDLKRLEAEGVLSTSQRYHPKSTSSILGTSVIHYGFATSAREDRDGFWTPSNERWGTQRILKEDEIGIKAYPHNHKIVYLKQNPNISAIHPINKNAYEAIIRSELKNFTLPFLIVLIFTGIWIHNKYKQSKL